MGQKPIKGCPMKVTLDLDLLLQQGKISQAEYDRLSALAAAGTASLAFNILISFGVIAVSGAALALVPAPVTAVVIGLAILIAGLMVLQREAEQWRLVANICILVGALMAGGGIIALGRGSLVAILGVALFFGAAALLSRSNLLAVLATLMGSAAIGARTGYYHASYFLVIQEPSLTILVFTFLAIGLYSLSKQLSAAYARLAVTASRTGVFLVNFGFWVGSLWGDRFGDPTRIRIPESAFSLGWALALTATALWALKRNHRWVLNTVATFGGIHFYTQWFEHLGASPQTVLLAGLLTLGFAVGLRRINSRMKEQGPEGNGGRQQGA